MNLELRGWQLAAKKEWESAGFRGCISVATGGGKTIFALSCFIDLRRQDPEVKILVIVPTLALLDQWYDAFATDLGIEAEKIKVLNSSDLEPDSEINLVVLNSARKLRNSPDNLRKLFLVVDECHRAASPSNSKALEIQSEYSLGLSATPFREYDTLFADNVAPKIGSVIFEYSVKDAINDGVLSQMTLVNVRVPLNGKEAAEYQKLSVSAARAFAAGHDESGKMLLTKRARVSNNARMRVPTVVSLLSGYRNSRVIIFFESISEVNRAADLLTRESHHVVLYHSKIPDYVRRANLKLFRKGAYDVLITCRALDEGFNVPEASVAVIAAGTASKRQRTQRMGRVLRAMPGKGEGKIITIYATDEEEARLVREIRNLELENRSSWLRADT